MNYAKLFQGNAAAGTTAAHYYLNYDGTVSNTTFAASSYIEKERVIGEAIENTLKDCGLTNCKYYGAVDNKPVSYLCLDDEEEGKPGFYIFYNGTYTYFLLGYNSGAAYINHVTYPSGSVAGGTRVTSSNADVFSTHTAAANSYNFYVKVIGDTASTFYLQLSSYGSATFNNAFSICIANIIDKRNDRGLFGYYFGTTYGSGAATYLAPVYKDTGAIFDGTTAPTYVTSNIISNNAITVDNYIVLVNQMLSQYVHLWFVDGYIRPDSCAMGQFYSIDGDTYFSDKYTIYKCPTQITPS